MKSHILCVVTALISLYVGSTYYYYSPLFNTITNAVAVIHPTKGNTVSGIVQFSAHNDGVHIEATITGLTPGLHGIHIHELGDCGCDDAVCAGDHFNPTQHLHGAPTSPQRHIGDMGNLTADAQGNATYQYIDTQMALNGPHSIIGRTVIIHAGQDDFVTQPTGNSGARIGCGVIGLGAKK